jgi:flagellar protein FlaI
LVKKRVYSMAIDEADQSGSGGLDDADESATPTEDDQDPSSEAEPAGVGEYTWADFMEEYGYRDEVSTLYPDSRGEERLGLDSGAEDDEVEPEKPSGDDWNRVSFDPVPYLGFHPDELGSVFTDHEAIAEDVDRAFWEYIDPVRTPAVKGVYEWEHFKQEFYYDGRGTSVEAAEDGEFDPTEYLGFEPDHVENKLSEGESKAEALADIVEERTVNIEHEAEDEFFSTVEGHSTVVNRYDLEKAVPLEKKSHFREEDRYWVNKPYAFVILFHSEKENEKKYYLIEPYLNQIEIDLKDFLSGKLRTAIKYADDDIATGGDDTVRKGVIERETKKLLQRYDLFTSTGSGSGNYISEIKRLLGEETATDDDDEGGSLHGIQARPEPAVLADDAEAVTEYQVEKLLYLLKRDFIGYERIDGIKHDINVEDISCDGYNSPVFVYHSDYEQIISNIYHGEEELDDFVVKLAQRSGKGISKRRPQVDATLPDGSRSQLTLGREVSDHGTNYTIRQFNDVPFTPIDLINWDTFSLDEMAFLWLCIENHKSLIFAGGTASGKTTSLNAISLFIPSSAKIVSIEDTREVELPQRNWIASVTRPSFSDDSQGDVDEFDLLEAALRQRPDYIVMGEIRGEEGRTLFQVMSTGHTTYTTFHADSVGEVLKRFTTDPINVSKTMFTALDLVSIQTQTRVQGNKVRRNKVLTEVNHYDAENDEINVQDVYQWQAETDEFLKMGESNTLETIKFDRGWGQEHLERELEKRRVILAYLIKNGLNTYTEVAATAQAFINDPDTILTLIANGVLEESLEDLREMESVLIDVDPEKEALVPRPDPDQEGYNEATDILERAEESILQQYKGKTPSGLSSALGDVQAAEDPEIAAEDNDEFDFGGEMPEGEGFGVDEESFSSPGEDVEEPDWFTEESGFYFGDDEDDEAAAAEASADASAEDVAPDARDAIENLDTDASAVENAESSAAESLSTDDDDSPALDDGQDDTSEDAVADAEALDESEDEPDALAEQSASAETEPQGELEGETADTPEPQGELKGETVDADAAEPQDQTTDVDAAEASAEADARTGPESEEPATEQTEEQPAGDAVEDGPDPVEPGPDVSDAAESGQSVEAETPSEQQPAGQDESVFGETDDAADADEGGVFGDDDSSPAEQTASTTDEGSVFGDDDDGDVFGDAGESDDTDDEGGVFGDTGESDDGGVFGDDDASEDGDEGSIFGEEQDTVDDASEDADEGGVFGDDDGTDDGEDDGGVFGDAGASDDEDVFGEDDDAESPFGDRDETDDTSTIEVPDPEAATDETGSADAETDRTPDDAGTPSAAAESTATDADAAGSSATDTEPAESMFDDEDDDGGGVFSDTEDDEQASDGSIFDEIDSADDRSVFSEPDDEDADESGGIVDERIEGFEYVDFGPEDGGD